MPRTLDIKNSFITGEISPLLLGRTDLVKYNTACELIQNFIVRLQGGLSRRPGLRRIGDFNYVGPGKLIPFIFSSSQAYVLVIVQDTLDLTKTLMFFYTNQDVIRDPLNPYFIHTPWNIADDLEQLKFAQVGDTMYIVHPLYPVQKLNRLSDTDWVITQPRFRSAPATQQDEDISGGTVSIIGMGPIVPPVNSTSVATAPGFVGGFYVFVGNSFGTLAQPSDIGKTLTAGTGSATIIGVQGDFLIKPDPNGQKFGFVAYYSQINIKVNSPFDTNTYAAGNWTIHGSPDRSPNVPLNISNIQIGVTGDMSITVGDSGSSTPIPTFIDGDIGKQIIAGTGIAQIVSLGGTSSIDPVTGATLFDSANVIIVDEYDSTTYEAGTWFLRGSPSSYFAAGALEKVGPDFHWHGSNQFGLGSSVPIRALNEHPTDYSFQQSTGTAYIHVVYTGSTTDTFRVSDVGRYVSFSGGYGQVISLGTGPADPMTGAIPNGATAITVAILSPPKSTESDAFGNLLIAVAFPGSWFFDDVAFAQNHGFPGAVCFFQQRLCFGGTSSNPQTIWLSVVGDFENFAKGTLDDDGIEVTLASGVFDRLLWMQPYLGNIISGTSRGEYTVGGGGNADIGQNTTAITPTNATATFQSAYGVTGVQPLIIQESLFFVQRLQLNVYEMEFDIQSASYDSKDLTLLNNFITRTPFIEMSYQQNQSKIVWFIAADPQLTTDGNLIGKNLVGFTFEKTESVGAWHRHITGLPLEAFADSFISMCVIPNNVNGAIVDELWVMVKRKVLGKDDVFSIELLDSALNVDWATHLISNTPVVQITGLAYLEGETVYVVADGALLPPVVMDNTGIYTFPPGFSALDVQAGINYISNAITVRPGNSPQGIIKRWNKIWTRVYNTLGITINGQFIPNRTPQDSMGQAVPLFTGDEPITNLGYDRDARIVIMQDNPLPAEILAIFGQLTVGEN